MAASSPSHLLNAFALLLLFFSLGSWVAVQRKEYKALQQGKPSKMTEERIIQLESIGFEWVARRGQDD